MLFINDDDFPKINCDPCDVFSLKSGFLSAYPNTLVLGYPIIVNQTKFTLQENSYIKIEPDSYGYWCTFFNKFGRIITKQKKKDHFPQSIEVYKYKNFRIVCEIKNVNCYELKVVGHQQNKFTFLFDSIIYNKLCVGFIELYFKPFCLPVYVNNTLFFYVQSKNFYKKKSIVLKLECLASTIKYFFFG